MWIDVDTIIKTAALVTALGVLGGVAVSLYRASERDRKQSEIIKEICLLYTSPSPRDTR